MTDADALLAHCLDHPDDHSARLVWLDAFQERHGETPWVQATREFIRVCGERRKYEMETFGKAHSFSGKVTLRGRRALPGWREWLEGADEWARFVEHHRSRVPSNPFMTNWLRLVPSLLSLTTSNDYWRRKGATIELQKNRFDYEPYRARLTFAHGFLARAEFRDWRSADAMLPAILADQPFVEAGIRGQPVDSYERVNPKEDAYLHSVRCGPAWSLVEGHDRVDGHYHSELIFGKVFLPGPKNDALTRARRALSTALRQRALTPASAPAPVPG